MTDKVVVVVIGKMTPVIHPFYVKWPILDGPFLFLLMEAAGQLLETFAEPDIGSPDGPRDFACNATTMPADCGPGVVNVAMQ